MQNTVYSSAEIVQHVVIHRFCLTATGTPLLTHKREQHWLSHTFAAHCKIPPPATDDDLISCMKATGALCPAAGNGLCAAQEFAGWSLGGGAEEEGSTARNTLKPSINTGHTGTCCPHWRKRSVFPVAQSELLTFCSAPGSA